MGRGCSSQGNGGMKTKWGRAPTGKLRYGRPVQYRYVRFMHLDKAWVDKADYLFVLFGAGAVGALLDRIAAAVQRDDDLWAGQLDRLLQQLETQLQLSSADGRAMPLQFPHRIAEPLTGFTLA